MAKKKNGRKKPRKTSRRKNASKKVRRVVKSQWSKISTGAGVLAFVQQVTGHDMIGTTNLPVQDKAKVLINSLVGRISGFSPFGGNIPQTINFGGIFNKWSGIGSASLLYSMIPVKVPHKGKAKTLGKNLLTAGLLGGIFSEGGHPSHTHQLTEQHSVTVGSTQ